MMRNNYLKRLPCPLQHWINPPANFLAHHHVYKRTEVNNDKIRVVFDASAKTSNRLSLNDVLMSGPTCQKPLKLTLLKFCICPIAFSADIRQMNPQIRVHESHQCYTRIVWRDMAGDLAAYQMTGITFGLAPSAFLATPSILSLKEKADTVTTNALDSFFVDDSLQSFKTELEASELIGKLISMLSEKKCKLCKFKENNSNFIFKYQMI
jgi:hypothetical protein